MDAFKISIKLFAASDTFGPTDFIPIFHRWIQTHAVADHLLIDVADYAHVPAGPGTLIVSSEANIYMDRGDNRLGLLYFRKLAQPGDFRERLTATLAQTLKIAALLEQSPELAGRLKFRTDEIAVRLNDRLLAPNTPATFAEVKPDLEAVFKSLYAGKPFTLNYQPSALKLFEVAVKSPGETSSVETLLPRINSAQPALSR
jgi:hypothetical protein